MRASIARRLPFSLPGTTIMDRYLVSELLLPFLFGVAAFASIGMAIGSLFELVRLITESGLPILTALQVFALRLPQIITYTFPMSMLLATLIAFGRLSGDEEITVLQASGVSIYRIVAPTLVLSVVVSVITFVFNEVVVPTANQEANITLARAVGGGEKPKFSKDNILYPEYSWVTHQDGRREFGLNRLFYARRFSDGVMYGLTILDYSQADLNQVITADSATYDPASKSWRFHDGTSYVIDPGGNYRNILRFQEQQVKIDSTPLQFAQEARRPEEMTTGELRRYIHLAENARQDVKGLLVSLYQKYAIPSVCFAFALIGAPLGLRRQRTSNALGLGLSVLIIFTYYIFLFVAQALGQTGTLPPWLGAWLPALVTMAIGAWLLWRVNQ
ncbi:LptF/LptG family permease [Gloeobacter kilaueensis]|nr:LptF/LptG family permease [Gloeobacter kilaueensis]